MPFATAKEKAAVKVLLAGLSPKEQAKKVTDLARADWENGKHGAGYYREVDTLYTRAIVKVCDISASGQVRHVYVRSLEEKMVSAFCWCQIMLRQ